MKVSITNVNEGDDAILKLEIQGKNEAGHFMQVNEITLDPDEGTVVDLDDRTTIQLIPIPTKPPV